MTARDCRLLSVLLVAVATIAGGLGAAAAQPQELPAQIATTSGRVEVARKSAPAWKAASLRDEVAAGDAVRTVGGRVTLLTGSGQALRAGPRTQVALAADGRPGEPTRIRLDGGRLWIAVQPSSPAPTQIAVRAGPATVTVRTGGVGVVTSPDGSVVVSVYHGAASVAGDGWERALGQDQEVVVPGAGPPKDMRSVKRDRPDAEWIKWNEQQDRAGGYGARVEK